MAPTPQSPFPSARVIVFDLDGTLVDSRRDITCAVNHTLETSGRAPLSERVVSSFVGDGALVLLQRATGLPTNSPELGEMLEVFRQFYTEHATRYTTVYPGVMETLEQLRGSPYHIALCTNKPRITTDRVLAELDLGRHFEVAVCADDLPFKKPHPAPLLHIARQLNVLPRELVMVGDGPQDIGCGKAAGAGTVGVTYGIRPKYEVLLAQPDVLLDALSELMPLLL